MISAFKWRVGISAADGALFFFSHPETSGRDAGRDGMEGHLSGRPDCE